MSRRSWDVSPSRDLGRDDARLSMRHGHTDPRDYGRPGLLEAVNGPRHVTWGSTPATRTPPPRSAMDYDMIPRRIWPSIRPELIERYGYPVPPDSWNGPGPYPWGPNPNYPPGVDPRLVHGIDIDRVNELDPRWIIHGKPYGYPEGSGPSPRGPNPNIPPDLDPSRLIHGIDNIIEEKLREADMRTRKPDPLGSAVLHHRDPMGPNSLSRSGSMGHRTPRAPIVGTREITRSPRSPRPGRPNSSKLVEGNYAWVPDYDWRESSYVPLEKSWWDKPIWNDRGVGLTGAPLPREPWDRHGWVDHTPHRPVVPTPPQGPRLRLTDRGRQYRDSLFYPREPLF